jgi:uncharacterized surface protein with fasciclin (FAS1) repeats
MNRLLGYQLIASVKIETMIKVKNSAFWILLALMVMGCKNTDWDEHYGTPTTLVDKTLWEALQEDPELSRFVEYLQEYQFDTLLTSRNTFTIFAPTNEAFELLPDTVDQGLIAYHVSTFFINASSISGKRKIQTFNEKFALFDNTNFIPYFDDIRIQFESPLYLNGKYFKMNQVAIPKPNLYEYISLNNPLLKHYIDSKDSLIIDKELSKPIGFDEHGNTIYDTVAEVYNKFEADYFPVSKELRNKTATIVFPMEEDYQLALTDMALSIGLTDYNDIPVAWQEKFLIPYLLKHGIFENLLEIDDLTTPNSNDSIRLKNILGDSIYIDYVPTDKKICSNGYAYNYENFTVPDTLYNGNVRIEAETLLNELGVNKFGWFPFVTVASDQFFAPLEVVSTISSNDSIIQVNFTKGYTGKFSVEFNADYIFPRSYRMVVRTNMNTGGIYNVYVNDELVKTFDYYSYTRNKQLYISVTGDRYMGSAGFNIFDCWVNNITEIGKAKIRFEYTAPGMVANNGFMIDYIQFIPITTGKK